MLECPVCVQHMFSLIATCVKGHSICFDCKEKLSTCPLWRQPFSTARNIFAESMISKMRFSCPFSERGCRKQLTFQNVLSHEGECEYRPLECPSISVPTVECPWMGNATSVVSHIRTMHNTPTNINIQNIKLYSKIPDFKECCKEFGWMQVMFCMGETFFMDITITGNDLHLCLQHVGLPYDTPNFKYKVSIAKENKSGNISIYNT